MLSIALFFCVFPLHCYGWQLPLVRFDRLHALGLSTVDDKAEVKAYFDTEGFSRWNKIYSKSDEVNKVQMDIRTGHQMTIDKVMNWVSDEDNSRNTLCDAGCGVGSLAIPMSSQFKRVYASDISASMTKEASTRAKSANVENMEFKVSDLENLSGKYNTVACIDVMIHYPTDKVCNEITYVAVSYDVFSSSAILMRMNSKLFRFTDV